MHRKVLLAVIIVVVMSMIIIGCADNGAVDEGNVESNSQEELTYEQEKVEASITWAEEKGVAENLDHEVTESLAEIEGIKKGYAIEQDGKLKINLNYYSGTESSEVVNINNQVYYLIGDKHPDKEIDTVGGEVASE